ncbi:arylsulfatase [Chitinophaga lutea]
MRYFFFLCGWLMWCCTAAAQDRRPNIILIMADDLGYGDLGCYGQQRIRTPHIDALAREGTRYTRYYAGNAVCAPSREALLTGKHTGHTAIRGNFLTDQQEDPPMPPATTIASLLQQAGYHTGLVGKWGLGGEAHGPEKQGFGYSYGYLDQIQAHNYFPPFLYENGRKQPLPENADGKTGVYSHHRFVEKTFGFLDQQSAGRPFFLYLPYTLPHGKHVIPDNSAYPDTAWPEQFRNYAAMISLLDADVGRIMEWLKARRLDQNTLVIFTSDNGANPGFAKFFRSNGDWRGHKTNLYEGGIRVPLILRQPGVIPAGHTSDETIAAWDLLPTLCKVAGVPAPAGIDGVPFLPSAQARQRDLYWEYYTYNYDWAKPGATLPRNWLDSKALVRGDWKLIRQYRPDGTVKSAALYDLAHDAGETTDVSAAHPALMNDLGRAMDRSHTDNAPFFPYPSSNTRK